jgi:hypothetical protein
MAPLGLLSPALQEPGTCPQGGHSPHPSKHARSDSRTEGSPFAGGVFRLEYGQVRFAGGVFCLERSRVRFPRGVLRLENCRVRFPRGVLRLENCRVRFPRGVLSFPRTRIDPTWSLGRFPRTRIDPTSSRGRFPRARRASQGTDLSCPEGREGSPRDAAGWVRVRWKSTGLAGTWHLPGGTCPSAVSPLRPSELPAWSRAGFGVPRARLLAPSPARGSAVGQTPRAVRLSSFVGAWHLPEGRGPSPIPRSTPGVIHTRRVCRRPRARSLETICPAPSSPFGRGRGRARPGRCPRRPGR